MYDRDFVTTAARSQTSLGDSTRVSASWQRKEFGANNFYGGNAPSREWTNQTLLTLNHRIGALAGWSIAGVGSYRTHGDRFVFNQTRPELSDNRHRTHAAMGTLSASRRMPGGSLTIGTEAGQDWIRSTNLGNHTMTRVSAFGEWRRWIGSAVQVDAGLRVDRYSEFGAAWSPSLGAGWWLRPSLRLRASAARAFRVPTFTERYYQDPAHLARSDVSAETAWAGEAGADVFLGTAWMLTSTLFARTEDGVIDWLRQSSTERWRTYNVRDVQTVGVELSAVRMLTGGMFMQLQYTRLDQRAAAVTQLSKYLLDYAPHALSLAAAIRLPGEVRLAPRLELKQRRRSAGTSDYTLVDVKLSRRVGRVDMFVEGTNLSNASYQEVANVAMPGRAASAGVTLSVR